jgi:hypothetical protein
MSTRHLLRRLGRLKATPTAPVSRNASTAFLPVSRNAAMALVIGISALVPTAPASAAVALLDDTAVRVYDSAGLEAAIKQSAFAVAARTLAAASVTVRWKECDGAGPACHAPVMPGELVVRIVRSPAPAWARSGLPLGDAFVDRGTRSGVLATIYADRVLLLAASAGIDAATLLGRAIAHELGHLLLATNAHATRGLMRPVWSREDLRKGRSADWIFTPEEVAHLRRRF